MKVLHIILSILFIFLTLQTPARGALVTLLAGESYQLSSNDVAEVLTVLPGNNAVSSGSVGVPTAVLLVDGRPVFTSASTTAGSSSPAHTLFGALQATVIVGPRTVSSFSGGTAGTSHSLVTLRITDKLTFEQSRAGSCPALTAVIPNDPGNFNVLLEASSDLVKWSPVQPGSYGGGGSNRFFRVRIEQLP